MANIFCKYDDYYGTNPARQLAHKMKRNDPTAIRRIAEDLAGLIIDDCFLIPIPNKNGFADNTLLLAELICKRNKGNIEVLDVMKGCPRRSLYDCKKEGEITNESYLGFSLSASIPKGKWIYLVDNVISSGLTAYSALKIVPQADVLVHSIDRKTFDQSIYRNAFADAISFSPKFQLLLHGKNKL